MNYPKVSILVPTYNRSKYLQECLESVLMQDYPNFEVIVSDNASIDDTDQIIKKYLVDNRVKYYRQNSNIGIVSNWKKLLYEYATGEYGKLICDDDYLIDKEHVKKCINLILKNKLDIVLSGSMGRIENEIGLIKEIVIDPEIPEITNAEWWLENWARKINGAFLFLNFNDGAVFNIKRAKELEAFVPDCYGLDYEILQRFILSGEVGYVRGCHFVARTHPNNDGRIERFENAFAGMEMFNRIQEYGLSLGLSEKKMLKLKRRNIIVFTLIFLVNKWFLAKGVSLKSIYEFYNRMNKLNKTVFIPIITNYATLSMMFQQKNIKMYKLLKRMAGK